MRVKKINSRIDLPVIEEEKEPTCQLFQCAKCGVHPKAYSVSIAKGDDSRSLVQLLQVLPKEIKVVEVFGDILTDTEIIENLFCGKCGKPGFWTQIPTLLLEAYGMMRIPEHDASNQSEKVNASK